MGIGGKTDPRGYHLKCRTGEKKGGYALSGRNLHIFSPKDSTRDDNTISRSAPKDPYFTLQLAGWPMLLPVKNVHPPYPFLFTDLAQIDLGGFQVLMSHNHFGHDF
jgi:hypothetical protein